MGYYTSFELETKEAIDIKFFLQKFNECLQKNSDFCYPFKDDITKLEQELKENIEIEKSKLNLLSGDVYKWYEHAEDLTLLSEKIPNITFILYGEGEERDDIWKEYFKNGKCVHVDAEIVFPDIADYALV